MYRPYFRIMEDIFGRSGGGTFEEKLSSERLAYYVTANADETKGVCTTFNLNFRLTPTGFLHHEKCL